MARRIHILSEQAINQIAAGEVIENPASVVKELVENAIDAGASSIAIAIGGGGYQFIRISDNGIGMNQEDTLLSLQRHATSKIEQAEDLAHLTTMGFRGEALASIASIAKMRIVTAEENAIGTEVEVEGGKVLYKGGVSRSRGTTVEVRSLFYNVPARKKFQKSSAASALDVTKVATQQALAHFDVRFELIINERTIFSVEAIEPSTLMEGLHRRNAQLLGGHFETDVLEIDLTQAECRLKGMIGSPLSHRHNRSGQNLFINRRPVSCPEIARAIKDAYGTRIPSDRHPIFSLHVEIPPFIVDVNVHPQKKQVRFSNERELCGNIRTAICLALQGKERPIAAQFMREQAVFVSGEKKDDFIYEELPEIVFSQKDCLLESKEIFLPLPPSFRTIGLFSHYLILESYEKEIQLVFVDLLAAQARILFEAFLKSVNRPIFAQRLLIPILLAVSIEEEILLHTYEEEMVKVGFEIRQCGKSKFMIDAIPTYIEPDQTCDTLRKILMELSRGQKEERYQNDGKAFGYLEPVAVAKRGESPIEPSTSSSIDFDVNAERRLRKIALVTSRFANGRKKQFMLQEAEEILKQLMQTANPDCCPKGYLTMIYLSQDEIKNKLYKS